MEIKLETRGNTYFEHQTSISFSFDGEEYWFDMIEKGNADNREDLEVDFETDEDLPFELTDEIKNEMFEQACTR